MFGGGTETAMPGNMLTCKKVPCKRQKGALQALMAKAPLLTFRPGEDGSKLSQTNKETLPAKHYDSSLSRFILAWGEGEKKLISASSFSRIEHGFFQPKSGRVIRGLSHLWSHSTVALSWPGGGWPDPPPQPWLRTYDDVKNKDAKSFYALRPRLAGSFCPNARDC